MSTLERESETGRTFWICGDDPAAARATRVIDRLPDDVQDLVSDSVVSVAGGVSTDHTDRASAGRLCWPQRRTAENPTSPDRFVIVLNDGLAELSEDTDSTIAHAKRPLSEHLDDRRGTLIAKGDSTRHADQNKARVQAIIDGCGFERWSDVSASAVGVFVADLASRKRGAGSRTQRFYVKAFQQFARWLIRDRRARENPVEYPDAARVAGRSFTRRALTADGIPALLAATRTGPDRYGVPSADRPALCELALTTGLHASELRSLTWSSFDLDGNPPTVTVAAAYSKRRRDDTLPLRRSTAAMLRVWRTQRGSAASESSPFATPHRGNFARMLRPDLDAAGIEAETDCQRAN